LYSRFILEICLAYFTPVDVRIFCFSNFALFPPNRRDVNVFLHNTLLIDKVVFPKMRKDDIYHSIKLLYFRLVNKQNTKFLVQTKSTKNKLLASQFALPENIKVKLFYPTLKYDNVDLHAGNSIFSKLEDTFYLCYPSTRHPHKNHSTLFKACSLLPNTVKLKIILTISETELRNGLVENNIDLDVSDRFICVSELDRNEMPRLYSNVDAIIFPSFTESLGLPLIEASQFSLPVLASDAPYVERLICGAITFDPYDHHSVCKVICKAVELKQNGELKSAEIRDYAGIIMNPNIFLRYVMERSYG
jgi:glycosyltransferase involved in cell wall biosynthesis